MIYIIYKERIGNLGRINKQIIGFCESKTKADLTIDKLTNNLSGQDINFVSFSLQGIKNIWRNEK